jgi:hypothetical protein
VALHVLCKKKVGPAQVEEACAIIDALIAHGAAIDTGNAEGVFKKQNAASPKPNLLVAEIAVHRCSGAPWVSTQRKAEVCT